MTQTHNLRVSARTAKLTASAPEDADDGPPWTFSGVAVGDGDILHMDDGTPILFEADELRAAAETQQGEPLTVDHPMDADGRPVYPPPTSETVGKVARAGYVPGTGVAYEATTHDENIANGVQGRSYEVSVHPTFEKGEFDEETGAYRATNVRFRDLSVVSKGDSPQNTAQWGPNAALASYTEQTDIGAQLALTASAVHTPDYSGTNSSTSWSKPSLDDYGADDPNDVTGNFLATTASSFSAVETYDDLSLPVVTPDGELQWGALTSAHQMASRVDGLSEDEVSSVRSTIERLASEEFGEELGSDDEAEGSAYVDVEVDEMNDSGVRELVASLAAKFGLTASDAGSSADDDADGGGEGEHDEERPPLSTEVDSLEQEDGSEQEADEQAVDEPAEPGADANPEHMDNPDDPADDDNAEEQEQEQEQKDGTTDGQESEPTLADMTVEDLGDALKSQGFVTEDSLGEVTAQKQKAEKVDEIIAASDDYDDTDKEALIASADTLVEREYKRTTGATAAALPGTAGGRSLVASASGDDDDLDAYGTGVSE